MTRAEIWFRRGAFLVLMFIGTRLIGDPNIGAGVCVLFMAHLVFDHRSAQ